MSRLLKQKSCPDVSVTEGVDSDPGHTEPIFETEFFSQLPIAWKDRFLMEGLEKKTGGAV